MNELIEQIAALPMPVVIMTLGAPGSGKTTWLKPVAERLDMVVVSPDTIREWLLKDATDQRFNPLVWHIAHEGVELSLKAGRSVAVDALHHEAHYRVEEIAMYKSSGAKSVVAISFETPLEVCLERNSARERKVDESAIRQIYAQLLAQPITPDEGFDKVFALKY